MSDIVIVSVFGWQRTRNIYRGMRSTGGRCLSQTIPCMRTTTSLETPSSCVGSVIRQLRGLLYSVIVTLSARPVMLYEIMIVWEQLFLVLYIASPQKNWAIAWLGFFLLGVPWARGGIWLRCTHIWMSQLFLWVKTWLTSTLSIIVFIHIRCLSQPWMNSLYETPFDCWFYVLTVILWRKNCLRPV